MSVEPSEVIAHTVLTPEEQRVLHDDRIRAVAQTVIGYAAIAEQLGGGEVESQVKALRETLEHLDNHSVNKLAKAFGKASNLLGNAEPTTRPQGVLVSVESVAETPAPEVSAEKADEVRTVESLVVAGPISLPTIEGIAEKEDQPEPAEEASEPVVPVNIEGPKQLQFDERRVTQLYRKINRYAGRQLLQVEPYDPDEVIGLIDLYSRTYRRRDSATAAARAVDLLEGMSYATAAETYGSSTASLSQFLVQTLPAKLEKVLLSLESSGGTVETAPPVAAVRSTANQRSKSPTLPQQPVHAERKDVPPVTTPLAVTRIERPLEEEPRHVQLAEKYAEVFEFDGAQKAGFRSLLDPRSSQDRFVSPAKREATEKIVNRIVDAFGDLDGQKIGLGRAQVYPLRSLLGIFFDDAMQKIKLRNPKSVYEMRNEHRNSGCNPNEIDNRVYDGLTILLGRLETAVEEPVA